MATPPHTTTTHGVDDAIARVLEAERTARGAVTLCSEQAEAIRQAARARAHGIAERAAERAAAVHRWTDASIRARVDALNQERAALRQATTTAADEPQRLARALDRLAEELAGGSG